MVHLSSCTPRCVHNTGKYVGRIHDVVLSIKKGRVSLLKKQLVKPDKKVLD